MINITEENDKFAKGTFNYKCKFGNISFEEDFLIGIYSVIKINHIGIIDNLNEFADTYQCISKIVDFSNYILQVHIKGDENIIILSKTDLNKKGMNEKKDDEELKYEAMINYGVDLNKALNYVAFLETFFNKWENKCED